MIPTNQPESDNSPIPESIKGTGYYTPMDIAPGEFSKPQQPDTELRWSEIWLVLNAWKAGDITGIEMKATVLSSIAAECQAARIDELERFIEWLYNPTDDYQLGDAETWIRNRLAALRSASREDAE